MANKNNFVKLGLIRTFTMTNFAILLRCVCTCVRSCMCVWDPAWVGAHEYYTSFLPMSMFWTVRWRSYDVCTVGVQVNVCLEGSGARPSLLLCACSVSVFSLCARMCVRVRVCAQWCMFDVYFRVIWLPFTHQHTTSIHNESTVYLKKKKDNS